MESIDLGTALTVLASTCPDSNLTLPPPGDADALVLAVERGQLLTCLFTLEYLYANLMVHMNRPISHCSPEIYIPNRRNLNPSPESPAALRSPSPVAPPTEASSVPVFTATLSGSPFNNHAAKGKSDNQPGSSPMAACSASPTSSWSTHELSLNHLHAVVHAHRSVNSTIHITKYLQAT